MSTFAELMEAVKAALVEFKADFDFEEFKTKLAGIGGTSVETLREVSWEDLQELGLPKLVAKRVAKIFRSEDGDDKAKETGKPGGVITPKKVPYATPEELVQAFDPRQATSPVAEELKKRSGGRPFVVFDRDGGIHRKLTLQLLEELIAGDEPRQFIKSGGDILDVFAVGELPPEEADEHPLFKGRALRRDGTDDAGRNWAGLSLAVRRMLRYAVDETHELRIRDADHEADIFERASKDGALAELQGRYVQAHRAYMKHEDEQTHARLKVPKKPGGQKAGSGTDPFYGTGSPHRRY
jgi:hypothetical protein